MTRTRAFATTALLVAAVPTLLGGCAAEGAPGAEATVSVCVGTGDDGTGSGEDLPGSFVIEAVQEGEVVGTVEVHDATPTEVGLGVPPGETTVRFAGGETIGMADLTGGGEIAFSIGDGCPLAP